MIIPVDQDEITAALSKLTDSVNGAVKQAAVNCTKLEQHETTLRSIERHCERINGNVGAHTSMISEQHTRIALLEAQGEPAKRKAIEWREDWWKFLLGLLATAAGAGINLLANNIS